MTAMAVKFQFLSLMLLWLPTDSYAAACPDGSDVCSEPGADRIEAAPLEDSSVFLQVFQQMDERAQGSAKGTLPSKNATEEDSFTFESLLDETESCSFFWEPFELMRGYQNLRLFGYAAPRQCRPRDYSQGVFKAALGQVSAKVGLDSNIIPVLIPITFIALFFIIIVNMLVSIAVGMNISEKEKMYSTKVRRPEAESWNRGIFSWLYCDFVNEWVSKFGKIQDAEQTRVKSNDLGKLGDPEDDCERCYERMVACWNHEVAEMGVEKASLIKVLIRYTTWKRLISLGVWTGMYEACLYIFPPAAMATLISMMEGIYLKRAEGYEFEYSEYLPATAVGILLFTGIPIACSVCNTFTAMLSMRMTVRMCGGLSCLVYRKAQRLPTSSQMEASKDEAASQEVEKKLDVEKKDTPDSSGRAGNKVKRHIDVKAEPDIKDHNEIPEKFSLVQVVAKDANSMLVQFPVTIMKTLITIPIVFVLFILLYIKIGWTLLVCIVASVVMVYLMGKFAEGAAMECYGFLYWSDKRLRYLEELFFNIRTLKACGWEEVADEKVGEMRSMELQRLYHWFWNFGYLGIVLLCYPKVMITLSLWGYLILNDKDQVKSIWTVLPLLFAFQSAFLSTMASLPIIVNAFPSFMRLQAYMKLHEAPNGAPRNEEKPAWMHIWEETTPQIPRAPMSTEIPRALPDAGLNIKVQGNFSWLRGGKSMLKDIDLIVPAGSSLAILGKVGSGKSTLLMAMLGELYPVGDSRICIPNKMAFCSQMPYVMEGTLQKNVVSTHAFDAERYSDAIFSSCLSPDLEILPGGDMVPIGSRGISLSGGQKARVSMARAAYDTAPVKVLDDPFSALDARTSRHVLEHYIHGDLLKGTTRIVVTQPDKEKIQCYDKVVVLSEGRIVCQGTPEQIFQTEEYHRLLNKQQAADLNKKDSPNTGERLQVKTMSQIKTSNEDKYKLREEEHEGRVSWDDFVWFLNCGGLYNWLVLIGGYGVTSVFNLFGGIVLQRWSSEQMDLKDGEIEVANTGFAYLPSFFFWWGAYLVSYTFAFAHGIKFTVQKSKIIHGDMVKALLHAPIDRFFDKTPVGRIMNRFTADNMQMDTEYFNDFVQVFANLWTDAVPLVYIHILMPVYFTLATLPVYTALVLILKRYFNTMIPLRYLAQTSRSRTNNALIEVDGGLCYVRAAQIGDTMFAQFMERMNDQLKADVGSQTFIKRWAITRIYLLVAFFTTSMVLLVTWVPNIMEYGALGLCTTLLLQITMNVENNIDSATKAQFQCIYMNRLHEYTKVPQERPNKYENDEKYVSFAADLDRGSLGKLEQIYDSKTSTISIIRRKLLGGFDVLLQQKPDSEVFVAPRGRRIGELDPANEFIQQAKGWHQVVTVNGISGDAKAMAQELCNSLQFEDDFVKIFIESGWLAGGARVSIESLCAGYGDIPRMVLKDITLNIEPCSNVGFVGATGCGKSTLLLCMLRIIERRGGNIQINDVDIADIGLQTLRGCMGLVPQDPVIMNASVRSNIDPFNFYEDSELWNGLRMVGLADSVKSWPGELYAHLAGEASGLSFGQRQLFCLARLLVRQPPLILLDEATSALDPKTQEIVQGTISQSFPKATLIVIAHRLETIMDFDKIVVMDKGTVAEQGSVKDLKDVKGGLFAKMLAAKQTW